MHQKSIDLLGYVGISWNCKRGEKPQCQPLFLAQNQGGNDLRILKLKVRIRYYQNNIIDLLLGEFLAPCYSIPLLQTLSKAGGSCMLSYKYWINISDKYYLAIADDLSREEIDTGLADLKSFASQL